MLFTDDDIEFIDHRWCCERIWTKADRYTGKYIFITEGKKLPRQFHSKKDKTILVVSGMLLVEIGPTEKNNVETIEIVEGESYHISPSVIHRLCAPEHNEVELIEVNIGRRDDLIILEDEYGQVFDARA